MHWSDGRHYTGEFKYGLQHGWVIQLLTTYSDQVESWITTAIIFVWSFLQWRCADFSTQPYWIFWRKVRGTLGGWKNVWLWKNEVSLLSNIYSSYLHLFATVERMYNQVCHGVPAILILIGLFLHDLDSDWVLLSWLHHNLQIILQG